MEDQERSEQDHGFSPAEIASSGRLLLGWGLVAAAAVMISVGWWGVSGQPVVAAQLAYLISGGIGGLLAGIIGVGLLVSNDVRKDRERLGRVEAAILELRQMMITQSEELAARNNGSSKLREPKHVGTMSSRGHE